MSGNQREGVSGIVCEGQYEQPQLSTVAGVHKLDRADARGRVVKRSDRFDWW